MSNKILSGKEMRKKRKEYQKSVGEYYKKEQEKSDLLVFKSMVDNEFK